MAGRSCMVVVFFSSRRRQTRCSRDWSSDVCSSDLPGNVLYARTGLLQPQNPEREVFPGLVLIALALIGAWRGWRSDAKPAVLAMAAIAALGFVLSLGPDGVRPFYATVHRFVFGFAAIRAPARFAVLVEFAMCVLGAIGFREIFSARTVRVSRHKDFYGDAVFVLLIARSEERRV